MDAAIKIGLQDRERRAGRRASERRLIPQCDLNFDGVDDLLPC
jgi:hypothetical protein